MSKNPVSKIFIVLAVLASAFVTLSFVARSTPSRAELSWPSRPVIIPLSGRADLSDYFLRHAERTTAATIPMTGASELSDFHQRHLDWIVKSAPVTNVNELSDFYQRFKARTMTVLAADKSDYLLRHPELRLPAANTAVDSSDYFLRHRKP